MLMCSFINNIARTSAVSSTNFRSILIFRLFVLDCVRSITFRCALFVLCLLCFVLPFSCLFLSLSGISTACALFVLVIFFPFVYVFFSRPPDRQVLLGELSPARGDRRQQLREHLQACSQQGESRADTPNIS